MINQSYIKIKHHILLNNYPIIYEIKSDLIPTTHYRIFLYI